MIQEAGDYLLGQLPSHPNHPKGRNAYAHVALCVKKQFGLSYKDIVDDDYQKVFIGKLPIMLKSSYCQLNALGEKDMFAVGECPYDQV
mgnify:CR=1 FL=1